MHPLTKQYQQSLRSRLNMSHTEDQMESIMDYIHSDPSPSDVLSSLYTFISARLAPQVVDGLGSAFGNHAEGDVMTMNGLHGLLCSLDDPPPAYARASTPLLYKIVLTFGCYPFPLNFFELKPPISKALFTRALALLDVKLGAIPTISLGHEIRVQGMTLHRLRCLVFDALAKLEPHDRRETREGADVEGQEDVVNVVTLLQPAFAEDPAACTNESVVRASAGRGFVATMADVLPRRVFGHTAVLSADDAIELISALGAVGGEDYRQMRQLWAAIVPEMLREGGIHDWMGVCEMEGVLDGWDKLVAEVVNIGITGGDGPGASTTAVRVVNNCGKGKLMAANNSRDFNGDEIYEDDDDLYEDQHVEGTLKGTVGQESDD